jgi:hypothetical protein
MVSELIIISPLGLHLTVPQDTHAYFNTPFCT